MLENLDLTLQRMLNEMAFLVNKIENSETVWEASKRNDTAITVLYL